MTTELDFVDAIRYAQLVHAGQFDKGGNDYMVHLLIVGTRCLPDLAAAVVGVLHDTQEDHPEAKPLEYIQVRFGTRIAAGVQAISREPGERYWGYIDRVSKNTLGKRAKIEDLIHNSDPARMTGPLMKDLIGMARSRYVKALVILGGPPLPMEWLEAYERMMGQ